MGRQHRRLLRYSGSQALPAFVVRALVVALVLLLVRPIESALQQIGIPAKSPSAVASVPSNIIVVGGSSGMGKAAALAALQRGGKVMLVGRTKSKLMKAKQELIEKLAEAGAARLHKDDTEDIRKNVIQIRVCDAADEDQVKRLAVALKNDDSLGSTGGWNGLVVSAAGKAPHGPVLDLPTSDTREMMESKVWTAYHCAKHLAPLLVEDGAVVFVAGILNRRPGMNCAPLAMANGALEGLTRSLALEWGPTLRVNCLSPGFCDTERFDHMDADRKANMLANTAASLPLKKVGQPSDMGEAIYYLLTAPFCTGVILDVDGGHGIRQYANPTTDPMRRKSGVASTD